MARRRKYTTLTKRDIKNLSDPNFWIFFIIVVGGGLGFIALIIFAFLFTGWLHTRLGLSNELAFILVLFTILTLVLASIAGVLIFFIAKYKETRDEREKRYKAIQIANIDSMTGIEFEHYLKRLLTHQGYNVYMTPASGDFGVDLIASKNNDKFAIQAKRYNTKVSRRAISDAVGGLRHYGCNQAVVITNNYFTPDAIELARSNGCILIDRNTLTNWIIEFQNSPITK